MSVYPLLYATGYLVKPALASAAIWPAHALTFFAFLVLPLRRWPWAAFALLCIDLVTMPFLVWLTTDQGVDPAVNVAFAAANILTSAGPASLVRFMRLFRAPDGAQLVISPLWFVALFAGALPGAILGAEASAYVAGHEVVIGDIGLWVLASALTMVTIGPLVFGVVLGFHEPAPSAAQPWEGWIVGLAVAALFTCISYLPWPNDQFPASMLFGVAVVWLALRFSHRATSIGVAVVAFGAVLLLGRSPAAQHRVSDLDGWRTAVISIEFFLLTGCGGALLINLMALRQRALLMTIADEHAQLRRYAEALDAAEDSARRATAADLHDGIGQILAGQSMTLAAMRPHATRPPLAALVDEAADASREAQSAIRIMIQDLSPPELDHASPNEALEWIANLFEARYGFRVTYRVTGLEDLARDHRRFIHRCVRELLMNARKHSQCHCADVDIHVTNAAVEISVVDEGIGFDAGRVESVSAQRFGLAQLRERVRTAGGVLEIAAAVGEGCRVSVQLPIESRESA